MTISTHSHGNHVAKDRRGLPPASSAAVASKRTFTISPRLSTSAPTAPHLRPIERTNRTGDDSGSVSHSAFTSL